MSLLNVTETVVAADGFDDCGPYGPVTMTHVTCPICGEQHTVQHSVSEHENECGEMIKMRGLIQYFECAGEPYAIGVRNCLITDDSQFRTLAVQFMQYLDNVNFNGLKIEPKKLKEVVWLRGRKNGYRDEVVDERGKPTVRWEHRDVQKYLSTVCYKAMDTKWKVMLAPDMILYGATFELKLFLYPNDPDCRSHTMLDILFPDYVIQRVSSTVIEFVCKHEERFVRVIIPFAAVL